MKVAFKCYIKRCYCSPNSNSHIPHSNIGFTIVELLVVIVVIGILAAITIVSYTGLSGKANVSSLQSDLSSAKKQLALYYVDHSSYPTSIDNITNCPVLLGVTDTKYCIKPSTGNTFTYSPASDTNPQAFTLFSTKNTTSYSITNSSGPISVYATGGTVTTDGSYRIHTFTTSGTLAVTTPVTADVLVVGGGGGGGTHHGGGGGGGGVVRNTSVALNIQSYALTVGVGGTGAPSTGINGGNGANSTFSNLTAIGGGGGGSYSNSGNSGGSGGASTNWSTSTAGGSGTAGQGFSGGSNNGTLNYGGGGGGSAGSAQGANLNTGGPGLSFTISGSSTYYGGGGGAGVYPGCNGDTCGNDRINNDGRNR
jgi:prepilin-type N-terminal cleavage/methylation domain-containing protein